MTVRVSKPAINLREKVSELDKPTGLKGNELMRSETSQEARDLIGAGRKNKFINGSMRISQRGTSLSLNADNAYSLDRIKHIVRGTHDSTYTQSSDHPDGFSKSLKISPNSTYTPSGSDNASFQSYIEGQDLQDLQFGTPNAKPFTVSFYAKSASSNNGHQYTFQIRSYPTSGDTRIKNFPFVVTTTWQRFTFTFTGDADKDIANSSAHGFACLWHLDAGPDDILPQYTDWYALGKFQCVTGQSHFQNNTSNEFYLTGVQIEIGENATEFEHLSYAEDLALCQRYFVRMDGSSGGISTGDGAIATLAMWSSAAAYGPIFLPGEMRVAPSLSDWSNLVWYHAGNTWTVIAGEIHFAGSCTNRVECRIKSVSNGVQGECGWLRVNSGAGYMDFNAEL